MYTDISCNLVLRGSQSLKLHNEDKQCTHVHM